MFTEPVRVWQRSEYSRPSCPSLAQWRQQRPGLVLLLQPDSRHFVIVSYWSLVLEVAVTTTGRHPHNLTRASHAIHIHSVAEPLDNNHGLQDLTTYRDGVSFNWEPAIYYLIQFTIKFLPKRT